MNWSGIRITSPFGKLLRLPLRLLPRRMRMPILQGRLRGKRWIVGASNHGCWLGSYEFDKQHLFEQTVAPGSVVFDLGGHVGFYTLLAAELVGPTGRVFVFEPLPRNLAYLREHLRLNRVENVTVLEAAVSDRRGVVSFDEGPNSSMGNIVAGTGSLQVSAVVLDELVAAGELPKPHYMKIDIEGAEARALAGARALLEAARPTIFLATHGSEVHRECCALLGSLGYDLRPIDGEPLDRSSEVLAVPRTSSGVRTGG